MPSLFNQKGAIHSSDQYHDIKNTTFQDVLFDLFIRLNKAIIFAGANGFYDNYTALVNHLEDLIDPLKDDKYRARIRKEIQKSKSQLMITKNYSEAEVTDEGATELTYLEARAKFKVCCKLIYEKLNFYPIQTAIDEI